MKVLLLGSGAREHALAWWLRQSPRLTGLWVANGNAGTAQIATNVDINPEDVPGVVGAAKSLAVDLVVVGPEVPLAGGIVDRLGDIGIAAFGPTRAAAQLETSKSFALEVMKKASVPAPWSWTFREQQEALRFLKKHGGPVAVKADGLAAGKGVLLCRTLDEAEAGVRRCMFERAFGDAGETVVIQELLSGAEVSVFAFTDGKTLSALTAACDYKRANDGDQGPNTGGMGSFAPPDFWSPELATWVASHVMGPVVRAMAQRGMPFRGVLYAGLILTEQGPRVLEFNCRFGDPEAQVVLPILDTDPLEVMLACIDGTLDRLPVKWRNQACVGVVLTSGGYPEKYHTGFEITGWGQAHPDTLVFHAGTHFIEGSGPAKVVTNGGRVLTVVGQGDSLAEARQRAYDRVRGVSFAGVHYRTDIGLPRKSTAA